MANQWGWRFCGTCSTVFWHEHINAGVCAAGGGHNAQGFHFTLDYGDYDEPDTDSGFFYCVKCHSLFHQKDYYPDHGSGTTLGICPKGGGHDPTSSYEYVMSVALPHVHGQDKWFVCKRCNCLNYSPHHAKCAGESDTSGVIGHIPDVDHEYKLYFGSDPADWIP